MIRTRRFKIALTGAGSDVVRVYWTLANTVGRTTLDGGASQSISSANTPIGVALDPAGGKVYWADSASNQIRRRNLDGTGVVDVVLSGIAIPVGVAIDRSAGKIYWTESSPPYRVRRANLDGTGIEDLAEGATLGFQNPYGIAVDPDLGKVYWTSRGSGAAIWRADLDGANPESVVGGLSNPLDVKIDGSGGKLYWTDNNTNTIQRANLDGTDVEELASGFTTFGIALDPPAGKIYWTRGSSIQRANLDGSSVEDIITSFNVGVRMLALEPALDRPVPTPSTTTLDFGTRLPEGGPSATKTLSVENESFTVLAPGAATITGTEADQFQITSDTCDGASLGLGQSCTIDVRFDPSGIGPKSATLEMPSNDPDSPLQIALTGAGSDVVRVYWTLANTVGRTTLDGGASQSISSANTPIGVALDPAGGKVYWADSASNQIRRRNLDGTGVVDVVLSGIAIPVGVAIDRSAGKIYWTESSPPYRVRRANLDGTGIEDLAEGATLGFQNPYGIAVDPDLGKVYWTSRGSGAAIWRADLDGANPESVVGGLSNPLDVKIDGSGGKLYWTDNNTNTIQRANLDGTDVEELASGFTTFGIALDPPAGKIYWTRGSSIQRANLDGSSVEDIITSFNVGVRMLALEPALDRPVPTPSTTTLDFGTRLPEGGPSATKTLSVENESFTVLAPGAATITGTEADQFQITSDTCDGASLGLGQSCTIDVRFDPSGIGPKSATLEMPSNDPDSPLQIALTGAGSDVVRVYWTLANTVGRTTLDGGASQSISSANTPIGVALDPAGGKVYWADSASNQIRRRNLDGTGVVDVVLSGIAIPVGVAIDRSAGKIYWTESSPPYRVRRANLDGTGIEDLAEGATLGFQNPYGIAVDPDLGKVYWTSRGSGAAIWRADLDGANPESVVGGLSNPLDVKIDGSGGKLYWTDNNTNTIQRANLDGTDVEELASGFTTFGIALDPPAGKIYWTRGSSIQRANLDGSSVEDIITSFNVGVRMLALEQPQLAPAAVPSAYAIDYDGHDVDGGPTARQEVAVTNGGADPLEVGAASLVGPDSDQFQIAADNCADALLGNAQRCTIDVVFDPTAVGGKGATLSVPSNDPNSPLEIELAGIGRGPVASPSATPLAFGSHQVTEGPRASDPLTITNTGNLPLTFGPEPMTITGANAAEFAVTADACQGRELAPDATCDITVSFDPASLGPKRADLVIASNDPQSPLVVPLTGNGTGAGDDALQIAFTELVEGNTDIYLRDPAQTRRVRETVDPGVDSRAAWSPRGDRIAYVRLTANGQRHHLRVRNVETDEDVRLMSEIPPFGRPTFSADGSTVIVASGEGLLEVPVDTPNRRRVIGDPADDSTDPAVIPNSTDLVVSRPRNAGRALAVIDDQGALVRWLTDGGTIDELPDVSPDGGRVYFARRDLGLPQTKNQVFALATDGSESSPTAITLPQSFNYATSPSLDPGGNRLIFEAGVGGVDPGTGEVRLPDRMYIADADGSNVTFLALGTQPAWRPLFDLCADQTQIPESECLALVDFYEATGGADWDKNDGWLRTPTPCSWRGVSCSRFFRGNVTDLRFVKNNLSGAIPSEILELEALEVLNLTGNDLAGPVPAGLPRLPELRQLRLNGQSRCLTADPATADLLDDFDADWNDGCFFAAARSAARWVESLQYTQGAAAGAIRLHQDPGAPPSGDGPTLPGTWHLVVPYRGSLAVAGLLRSSDEIAPNRLTIAEAWIEWYLEHLNTDVPETDANYGVVYDHWYREGDLLESLSPGGAEPYQDAADSYAATLLEVVRLYLAEGGDPAFVAAHMDELRIVAEVIMGLRGDDGLTWARADFLIKYLMDNSEVYRGLRAMEEIERTVAGDEVAATRFGNAAVAVQNAITGANDLFNEETGFYRIAEDENGEFTEADPDLWYGGTVNLAWPRLFGVTGPDDAAVVAQQMDAINDFVRVVDGESVTWWTGIVDPSGQPWSAVGRAALLTGRASDRDKAVAQAEFLIKTEFPAVLDGQEVIPTPTYPFVIDDAGWFIQTTATLSGQRAEGG